jgi:hypothetical protein
VAASAILLASQAIGQESVRRVGVLRPAESPESTKAWLDGLRERGYVVDRNLQVEYRYFQGRSERINALTADLVALGPEVIVTGCESQDSGSARHHGSARDPGAGRRGDRVMQAKAGLGAKLAVRSRFSERPEAVQLGHRAQTCQRGFDPASS